MNEMPAKLASHPRLSDAPELALQEAFEQVDKALGDAAKESEQVYRRVGSWHEDVLGVCCTFAETRCMYGARE